MNLEPPNMNVLLHKRDSSKIWFPALSGVLAWLWHRPMEIPQAAISFIFGGAIIWFALCSGFSHRAGHHRIPFIRWSWLIGAIVSVTWLMRNAIPYLHGLV